MDLSLDAEFSVDGPDVTNKILPVFFCAFFCREGVLVWFFCGGLFPVLLFLVEGPFSKFCPFLFLCGSSFSLSFSFPSNSSSCSFISSRVPSATTWERNFSNPFTLHIAPTAISSTGVESLALGTMEWVSSSGHLIK